MRQQHIARHFDLARINVVVCALGLGCICAGDKGHAAGRLKFGDACVLRSVGDQNTGRRQTHLALTDHHIAGKNRRARGLIDRQIVGGHLDRQRRVLGDGAKGDVRALGQNRRGTAQQQGGRQSTESIHDKLLICLFGIVYQLHAVCENQLGGAARTAARQYHLPRRQVTKAALGLHLSGRGQRGGF